MDPSRIDEDSTLVQDIAAAFKQLPGFQSVMIGVDRTTGQFVTVTTWDTEEHARSSLLTRTDLIARLQAVDVRGDPPEFFEVKTQA
jgi:hypothetical protein